MDVNTYELKQPVGLEAVQWDGTTAHAYEIVAWIIRGGGKARIVDGYSVQGPDLVHISKAKGQDEIVITESYVVRDGSTFFVVRKAEFEANYQIKTNGPRPIRGINVHLGTGIDLVGIRNSVITEATLNSDRTLTMDLNRTPGGKELFTFLSNPEYLVHLQFGVQEYKGGAVFSPDHEHTPVQHRDGKPPWCPTCGLTADGQKPKSMFDRRGGGE